MCYDASDIDQLNLTNRNKKKAGYHVLKCVTVDQTSLQNNRTQDKKEEDETYIPIKDKEIPN